MLTLAVYRKLAAFHQNVANDRRHEGIPGTADVVSLRVPPNDGTRHPIDDQALGRIKPETVLINAYSGVVVGEPALIDALRQGHTLGAGLDSQEQAPPEPTAPLLTLSVELWIRGD